MIPSPFGRDDDSVFDGYDEFVPDHVPEPDRFLDGHEVLAGDDHLAFHRLTRDLFEERTVYDVTFGYNLARLNLDARHPDAGYRYAREAGDSSVLRAEFTPTTPFCPQTRTLTVASFRAWNGAPDRHEYDRVRVRVAPMHDRSAAVNDRLADLERRYAETGDVRPDAADAGPEPDDGSRTADRGPSHAPF